MIAAERASTGHREAAIATAHHAELERIKNDAAADQIRSNEAAVAMSTEISDACAEIDRLQTEVERLKTELQAAREAQLRAEGERDATTRALSMIESALSRHTTRAA